MDMLPSVYSPLLPAPVPVFILGPIPPPRTALMVLVGIATGHRGGARDQQGALPRIQSLVQETGLRPENRQRTGCSYFQRDLNLTISGLTAPGSHLPENVVSTGDRSRVMRRGALAPTKLLCPCVQLPPHTHTGQTQPTLSFSD